MTKYSAILRGINVGGHKKILMADLKDLFIKMKFKNPVTYIQSGNVIFETDDQISEYEIIERIEGGIMAQYGFEVPVMVRQKKELELVVNGNPYLTSQDDELIRRLYVIFLDEAPSEEAIENLEKFDFPDAEYHIADRHMFICYAERFSKSKLSVNLIESKFKIRATARNWKTTIKLHSLMS